MLEEKEVPGTRQVVKISSTTSARTAIKSLNVFLFDMHKQKFSFGGDFSAEDLYVTEDGRIKVHYLTASALKEYTDKSKELDYFTGAQIIENTIFSGNKDLPEDILHLLKLMKHESAKFEYVIRFHISHVGPLAQLSIFSLMFWKLDVLEESDKKKYNNIIQMLPFGHGEWRTMLKRNSFLEEVYAYKSRQFTFSNSSRGLVKLCRNSIQHLPKRAVKVVKRKIRQHGVWKHVIVDRIVLFENFEIQHMICGLYVEFFGELQKAFHQEGELSDLSLEDIIK